MKRRKKKFIDAYGNRCLGYFLELISCSKRFEYSYNEYLNRNLVYEQGMSYTIHHNKKHPFFVRVFLENDLLFDFIEVNLAKPFKDVISYIDTSPSHKKKNQLKRGYTIYKKYDASDIKEFIRCVFECI